MEEKSRNRYNKLTYETPALSGCLECLALEVGNWASGTKLGSFAAVDSLAPYNNFSSPATKS